MGMVELELPKLRASEWSFLLDCGDWFSQKLRIIFVLCSTYRGIK